MGPPNLRIYNCHTWIFSILKKNGWGVSKNLVAKLTFQVNNCIRWKTICMPFMVRTDFFLEQSQSHLVCGGAVGPTTSVMFQVIISLPSFMDPGNYLNEKHGKYESLLGYHVKRCRKWNNNWVVGKVRETGRQPRKNVKYKKERVKAALFGLLPWSLESIYAWTLIITVIPMPLVDHNAYSLGYVTLGPALWTSHSTRNRYQFLKSKKCISKRH